MTDAAQHLIDLSPLLAERGASPFAIPPFTVSAALGDAEFTARASLRADRTNRGVRLSGRVDGEQRASCARCLAPLAVPLQAQVDEEAVEPKFATGEALVIGKGNSIEVGRLALEALDLVRALAPRCVPACPERCGSCGGEHPNAACPERGVDPRLAGLATLLPPGGDDGAEIG